MIIRFGDGTQREAVILSRTASAMRVAIQGSDDVTDLVRRNGFWITDDCEAVQVEFAWECPARAREVTEADCICPPELAARLIHLLLAGESDAGEPAPALPLEPAAGSAHPFI